jgi:hypothetical protein
MNRQRDGQMDGLPERQTERHTYGRTDGQADRRKDGCTERRTIRLKITVKFRKVSHGSNEEFSKRWVRVEEEGSLQILSHVLAIVHFVKPRQSNSSFRPVEKRSHRQTD